MREDLGHHITKIDKEDLLFVIMKKKNDNWRLGQICCSLVNDIYEVSYSFCKDYELEHYRLEIPRDEGVPSISRVYKSAIFYENEMRELFGLKVAYIKEDMHNTLYRIDAVTPFADEAKEIKPAGPGVSMSVVKEDK